MSSTGSQDVHAPDLIGPVIGFRQWRVAGDGLLSIACDERWREATLAARCLGGGHPQQISPASGCSCGVHAWYESCPRTASAATPDYVAGAVVMWGAIELHVTGMRAQHCQIVALALPLSRWGKRDRVLDVARHLDVPTVRHRDLGRAVGRCGAPVAAGLRPPRSWLADLSAPIGTRQGRGPQRPLR